MRPGFGLSNSGCDKRTAFVQQTYSKRAARARPASRPLLALIALLTAAPALAAEPWEGVWTAEPEWCQWADRIGSHNPAPILITAEEIAGLENTCYIESVRELQGMLAWEVSLTCQSEWSVTQDATLLMLEDDDTLWRYYGAGEPIRFTRCP